MRSVRKVPLALLLLAGLLAPGALAAESTMVPGFAVVELFTSEGCSSCPPADDVLSQLVRTATEQKLPIYALEWHVDYWDYLGWKDPWDSRFATERQYAYARSLPSSVYTPQLVLNGQLVAEYAGNGRVVESAARSLASRPSSASAVSIISTRRLSAASVGVDVDVRHAPAGAALLVAEVEGELSARPTAGENSGRYLVHSNVVRAVKVLSATSGEVDLDVPRPEAGTTRRIIALLQDPRSMHIFAAAQAGLTTTGGNDLSGRILDQAGRPIAGALIQACSATLCIPAKTDADGYFAFTDMQPGSYEIDVGVSASANAQASIYDHSRGILITRTVWLGSPK